MIHPLFTTFSFKILGVSLCLFLGACSNDTLRGTTSLSSSTGCAGDGGIVPKPPIPNFIPSFKKFDVSSSQKNLTLIVDEFCSQKVSPEKQPVTSLLKDQIASQGSLSSFRAYSYTLNENITLNKLANDAYKDECLIQVSNDVKFKLHYTPNDPHFSLQTHLSAINASSAWDSLYPDLNEEIVIAIIDDGMELTHSDLSGVLWVNSGETDGNGVDDDGNGYVDDIHGYNFASNLASPAHENGAYHGTHVAGLAAAQADNGVGITGVMGKNIKIMVLNVFGTSATSSVANIVNALNYAKDMGADVINMSIGAAGSSTSVRNAMVAAVAAGAFIAVSAGNDNVQVTDSNFYIPMGYAKDISGATSVGSVDATTLSKSSFSNYSSTYVELTAPGSNSGTGGVLSTYTSNSYNYLQGTSMSSPVVAGAAALLMGWARSNGNSIAPAQVESILGSSSSIRGDLSNYVAGGRLLNMANFVSSANCEF